MKLMNHLPITVNSVAAEIGVTPGRIRQVCQSENIGVMINPRMRLLDTDDAKRLKKLFQSMKPGRPVKKSEHSIDKSF